MSSGYHIHILWVVPHLPNAAYSVNKNRFVAGTHEIGDGLLLPNMWRPDLGPFSLSNAGGAQGYLAAGSLLGNPVAMNESRDIVSTFRHPDTGAEYVRVWLNGDEDGLLNLNTIFGGKPHGAVDINDNRIVLGTLEESPGVLRAFLYDITKGTVEYLPSYGKLTVTMPTSINNKGQVVGTAAAAKGDAEQPFLYDGKMHPLGDPGYLPACINDKGQVVGSRLGGGFLCETTNGALQFKHISAEGIRPDAYAWPTRINNKGDIVGSWTALSPDDQGLFLCKAGTYKAVDLTTLTMDAPTAGDEPPFSFWHFPYTYAVDISDGGHIVGAGRRGIEDLAFILVPDSPEVTAVTPPEVGTSPPVTELDPQARPPKVQAAAVDPLAVVLPPEVYRRLKLPDPAPFHAARARLRHALHALDPAQKQHMASRLETLSTLMRLLQRDLKGGGTDR